MNVRLDASKHQYIRDDGRIVLGVTEAIRLAGLSDMQYVTEAGLNRGRDVHRACELIDKGTLDWSTLDNSMAGYVHAYVAFVNENDVEILSTEETFHSDALGYAGTPDRRLKLNKSAGVLDIKLGAPDSWHKIQTAFYAMPFGVAYRRWNLYLRDDAQYRLVEHTDPNDFVVVQAVLTLVNWKRRNGYAG